jgi:archaemetzincin
MEGFALPPEAYHDQRRQYNATEILKRLMQYPHDSLRILAVTKADLYVPILKYVFGIAQIQGQCALISLQRLRPQFYDAPPDPALFLSRVEKTVLHELGHSLGLTHCRNRHCVMFSSTKISDTDLKRADFCPTCLELFKWHLDQCLACTPP